MRAAAFDVMALPDLLIRFLLSFLAEPVAVLATC